jgi:hypothetical protein
MGYSLSLSELGPKISGSSDRLICRRAIVITPMKAPKLADAMHKTMIIAPPYAMPGTSPWSRWIHTLFTRWIGGGLVRRPCIHRTTALRHMPQIS